jgi:hypothetical protein
MVERETAGEKNRCNVLILQVTYSVKLTESQFGPETPMAEWDESFLTLSRLVWYKRIERALD